MFLILQNTEVFVDRAIKAIENSLQADKPFYISLWPDDVHTPLEPPRHLRGNGKSQDLYSGVIKEMDNQLARIFDYIRNNPKLKNNTLIILSSDNGPAKNVGSSGGFRGFKGNLYEGGIKEGLRNRLLSGDLRLYQLRSRARSIQKRSWPE